MSVSESVSKLESAVNDKNQDQKQISAAFDEVSKLLKDPESIKEFNKSIADNKNDIGALKGLSLVKIDEQGNMEFSSTDGKTVEFNSQSNFKTPEKEAEKNQSKNVDFKFDKDGNAVYEVGKGDTVWGVAERICTEKKPGKRPTALEVYNEMNKIIKENPNLKNPDKIKEGRDTLILPKESVTTITEARKAAESKKSENKPENKTENKTDNKSETKTETNTNTENKSDNKSETNTENKTDNKTENTQCQTEKMVSPDQRKEFLLQEQKWLFSKGETKDTVFDDIDKDGDHFLTSTEINEYRVNKTIEKNPNHDAYLKELAAKREDIEEFNNDETWDENNGITKGDITSWTDSETLADRKAKELEQKKVELEQKKTAEEKDKQDAKDLLKSDEAFFLKASGYDGTLTIPDVEKYEKELAAKQPANEAEKQKFEREKKALVQIKAELERRSTVIVNAKTGNRTEKHDGVMTQQDSQTWTP